MILGRLVLLSAAALALGSAIALVRERDRNGARALQAGAARYVCPMHPEVASGEPGECPICHMELVRVALGKEASRQDASSIAEQGGAVSRVERRVVSQLVRAPAWADAEGLVTAEFHEDDLVGVAAGERALFFGSAAPGTGTPVRRTSDPPGRWDPSTVLVRFQVERPTPGETGWVQLSERPRELLVVPASALLHSGEGDYVLAASPDGHEFTRRDVTVGRILDAGYGAGLVDDRTGAISVLSGLKEGERVIVGDAFLLDAERRLQAARGNEAEVIR